MTTKKKKINYVRVFLFLGLAFGVFNIACEILVFCVSLQNKEEAKGLWKEIFLFLYRNTTPHTDNMKALLNKVAGVC